MSNMSLTNCGCVLEGTVVRTGRGNEKIERVCIFDTIVSPLGGCVAVRNTWKGIESRLLEIKTENGKTLSLTHNHPVLSGGTTVSAEQLKAGDLILTASGEEKVVDISEKSGDFKVLNLDVEKSAFYANGIAVGDNGVQNGKKLSYD
ncbi:hypothetical protein FACS1894133_0770 [Clostridia bacterium]|nr:hypothetical protein FACS1894133_0020 [Clostridia bacterium]GHU57589.1 hypothetical protein FACS1894133_0770 [Clostridia bacterium]